MPTYNVTDPTTGMKVKLTGDSPPTEKELNDVFAKLNNNNTSPQPQPKAEPGFFAKGGKYDRFMTGVERGVTEPFMGLAQRIGLINQQDTSMALKGMAEERQQGGTAGKIGEFGGGILPYAVVPGGATKKIIPMIARAGVEGATIGALRPTEKGESVTKNALIGATAGSATAGLLQSPKIVSKLLPETSERTLIKSGLKMSTNLKQSVQDNIAETMLKEKIPISTGGLKKTSEKISNINKEIDNVISSGSGKEISRDSILQKLEDLKDKYQTGKALPQEHVAEVQKVIDEFSQRGQSIPVQQAQEFKKDIYKELNGFYEAHQKYGVVKPQAWGDARATMASAFRNELQIHFPELANLNANDAALINLNKAMEKAMGRINNSNFLKMIPAILSGGKSVMRYAGALIADHPYVKSQLAIAIRKGRLADVGGRLTQTATEAAALGATQPQEKWKDIE